MENDRSKLSLAKISVFLYQIINIKQLLSRHISTPYHWIEDVPVIQVKQIKLGGNWAK